MTILVRFYVDVFNLPAQKRRGIIDGKQIKVRTASEGRLWVTMPPEKDWVEHMRSVQGRKWHPDVKQWSIPVTEGTIDTFVRRFVDLPVGRDSCVQEQFPQLRRCSPQGGRWRKKCTDALKLKGYRGSTEKAYVGHLERCMHLTGVHIDNMLMPDVRDYLRFSKRVGKAKT